MIIPNEKLIGYSCFVFIPKHWRFSKPIKREEISECIKNRRFYKKPIVGRVSRKAHIERIAYLIVYGFKGQVLIEHREIGESIFSDGNHRVAACIYKGIDIECEIFSKVYSLKAFGELGEWILGEYQKNPKLYKWISE